MPAGRLRDRAAFQEPVKAPDGGGGDAVVWADRYSCWGQLMVGSVRERLEAGRLQASGTAILRVRWSMQALQIKPSWRVVIRGVAYQIRSAPDDPTRKRQWLDMEVERGVAT